MSSEPSTRAAVLTEVNRRILDTTTGSLGSRDQDEEWEFFCECGRPDCEERVKLTVAAHSALDDGQSAVLAPGHRLSQIERARRLMEVSKALRAQAEQQVKRAKKNLGESPS